MDLAVDASTPASLDGDLNVAVVVFDRGEKGDDPVTSGQKQAWALTRLNPQFADHCQNHCVFNICTIMMEDRLQSASQIVKAGFC